MITLPTVFVHIIIKCCIGLIVLIVMLNVYPWLPDGSRTMNRRSHFV